MAWSRDETAVAASYQFAVGGAVLVLFVSGLVSMTNDFGRDTSSAAAAVEDARADSLADVALSRTWEWSEGQQASAGLLVGDGALALENVARFKGVSWDGASNERIDYAEAQQKWGVSSADFHLRIRPIDATGLYDLSGLRVAYVAQWTDVAEVHVDLGTDEAMVAGLRAQIDTQMTTAAADERAILAALGVDFDNKVALTAAAPVLLVDTVVPGGGKVYVCHEGNTLEIAASALVMHLMHGDSVGACPGDRLPGIIVSVPLLSVLSDLSLLEGDVYLDDVDYLDGALSSRWDDYDVLVVGSGSDPQALAQGSFPAGLAQHVLNGGLLVVFGGTDDAAWLGDLAAAGSATANEETGTPDLQHSVLQWPHPVDWMALDTGTALPPQVLPDASWQHVLGNGSAVELAVSQQGAYGVDGMGVVTSLRPVGENGLELATNIFAYYARQDLHLDYGAKVPEGIPVSSSMRTVWGEDAGGNQVAMRIQVLYWRG